MGNQPRLIDSILVTPPSTTGEITASTRLSLLSTVFSNMWPVCMAGAAGAFVALTALFRLHQVWAGLWLAIDIALLLARLAVVRGYVVRALLAPVDPGPWAALYAPLSMLYCLLLGIGTTMCVISHDAELGLLALMVTAGILGGIASRNAALPRLAKAQISLSVIPIGCGAALALHDSTWILVPPLFLYLGGMSAVVQRHYEGLVAIMTAEQKHAELVARFDAALANMPHGLCATDNCGMVIIANRRATELFGATADTLLLNVPFPEFIGQAGLPMFGESVRRQLIERCSDWLSGESRPLDLSFNDGRRLEMTRHSVPDGSAVIIIEDVTERRRIEAKMLHMARHDSLTGLPNRRDLCDRLAQKLVQVTNDRDETFAMMYLDLDGFKQVNDCFGHHAGDEVLVAVAGRLREALHHGASVARLGGDEFAVVLDRTTLAASEAIAQRLIDIISRPYVLKSREMVAIGTSIGIAFTADDDSLERLMSRADAALYEAKTAGKGTFRLSRGSIDKRAILTEI